MEKPTLELVRARFYILYVIALLLILRYMKRNFYLLILGILVLAFAVVYLAVNFRCPHCRKFLDIRNPIKFCPNCGKKLEEE